jgi:uncharacterized membrane protein
LFIAVLSSVYFHFALRNAKSSFTKVNNAFP